MYWVCCDIGAKTLLTKFGNRLLKLKGISTAQPAHAAWMQRSSYSLLFERCLDLCAAFMEAYSLLLSYYKDLFIWSHSIRWASETKLRADSAPEKSVFIRIKATGQSLSCWYFNVVSSKNTIPVQSLSRFSPLLKNELRRQLAADKCCQDLEKAFGTKIVLVFQLLHCNLSGPYNLFSVAFQYVKKIKFSASVPAYIQKKSLIEKCQLCDTCTQKTRQNFLCTNTTSYFKDWLGNNLTIHGYQHRIHVVV